MSTISAPDLGSLGRPIDLVKKLSPEAELVLLARTLWHQGYADQLAGHITYRQPDGTLLTNPYELAWDELLPSDVVRIDLEGNVLEGEWRAPGGINLHVALHRVRPATTVAVHNHPQWGTLWAGLGRVPPVYDQTSAFVDGEIAFFEEFGAVAEMAAAEAAARGLGEAKMALLSNHGVLVVGDTIEQAYLRAVTLEWRCRQAYRIEAVGGAEVMNRESADSIGGAIDSSAPYQGLLWEAAARREVRRDPELHLAMINP